VSLPGAPSQIGGKIQGGKNSPGSKVTWHELKCISIHKTRNVNLQWVNTLTYNFFVSGPKFTYFLFNSRWIRRSREEKRKKI